MSTETVIGQSIKLGIYAPLSDWQGIYDRLEVWRSLDGLSGPYYELTAAQWMPPRLPKDGGDPPFPALVGPIRNIVGKTLGLRLNERTDVSVTFTGVDPLTLATVVSQVVAQGQGLLQAWVDADDQFVVAAYEPGNKSILRVLETDAAPILGLEHTEANGVAYGHDARIFLDPSKIFYDFLDDHGSATAYYRTRYRNTYINSVSGFNPPFPAIPAFAVEREATVVGYLTMLDGSGIPTANREVRIQSDFTALTVNNYSIAGINLAKSTGNNGYVEFRLLRGVKFRLVIAGTLIAREFTTPTDFSVERFNLLDPAYGSDDLFKVQVPDLDYAARRTL